LTASLAARSLTARSLGVTGEYAKLELRGVPFGAVTGWLAQVRQESRITVEDANIVAQATPGLVDATLTLHQSADAVR
jgi:general secretion pathway protein M